MKRILFLTAEQSLARLFWRDEYFELAEREGFSVDVPAWEHNIFRDQLEPAGYDALFTTWGSPMCDGEFLSHAPTVRFIGHLAGSTASVVDQTTFAAGVRVSSCNRLMAEHVAEWSLMMTLTATRNLLDNSSLGREHTLRFGQKLELPDPAHLTVGIWGLGAVGEALLRMLAPIRFQKLLVYSEHAAPETLAAFGADKAESLEQLFEASDVLHLLAGATRRNLGRINLPLLERLRPGSTLINAGRARLVDESALLTVLKRGKIRAILDVFFQEPLPADNLLLRLPNVLCTPHNAGSPGIRAYAPFMLRECRRFWNNLPLEGEIEAARNLQMTDERLWKR